MNVINNRSGFVLGMMVLTGAVAIAASPSGIENFEASAVPTGWRVSANSTAEITSERFKSGASSLVWSWNESGAMLACAWPSGFAGVEVPYVNGWYPGHTLAFWVYNEKPMPKILRLELLNGERVIGKCWYVLNFKGWRPLGAPYREVLTNPVQQKVTGFRLIAPQGVERGQLCLDYVNPKCKDILFSDNQQPWARQPEILNSATPEKFIYSTHDISQNRPWLPPLKAERKITATERKDMETILDRCLTVDKAVQGDRPLIQTLTPKADPTVLDEFNRLLRIKKSPDGVVTGAPIIPAMYWGGWQFNSPSDGVLAKDVLERLVQAYLFEKQNGNKEQAAKLLSACFDGFDHLLDQGYAEGNYNVGCGGFGYRCVTGLRKELEETGRFRDLLLACAACTLQSRGGDALMREDWGKVGYAPRNTDTITDYDQILVFTALLPNEDERLQRLHAWSRAISRLCDPAIGAPYSWDGGGQHHMKFHTSYSGSVLMKQAYWVRDTVFKLTPEAIASLKQAYMVYAFMTPPDGILPPNIPGYTGWPQRSWKWLARILMLGLDTQDNRNCIDADFAGVWIANSPAQTFQAKLAATNSLNGHMTMNSAAIALHRRGDWLVSIVGQNKFRRGPEANGAYIPSVFNYYSCNGSVFVTASGNPVSTWDSGYSLEGWDSRLYPGTTSYLGENETDLYARMENVTGLGGGTDMDGDGIWGIDFIRSDMSFRKSAFCFGDRITLVTTDVKARKQLPLVTTLYQNAFGSGGESEATKGKGFINPPGKQRIPVPPEQEPCWSDGKKVVEFPQDNVLPTGGAHWLVDNKHTGYYVHPECPPLHLTRREQSWTYPYRLWAKPDAKDPKGDYHRPGGTDPKNYIPTTGNFATAWFEHGATTECVYSLIPKATPERMTQIAKDMESADTAPYVILQKDAKAHILRDQASSTIGYILFEKGAVSAAGKLREVNRPCYVMVKQTGKNLRLSVASMDLDGWPPEEEVKGKGGRILLSGDVVLTIDGKWKVQGASAITPRNCRATYEKDATILRIPFKDFQPVVLTLEPARLWWQK